MENTVIFESTPAFSVPCDVVDRHLSAPETELKLILLLLRNAGAAFLKDDLLRTLGVDETRLKQAFQYWVKAGVLYKAGGKYTLQRPQLSTSDIMTYNPDTVASRMENDIGLQFLYQKAEEALKKPLTSADASILLSLVDWAGLPSDVVALLIQYGSENGMSLRQMNKVGLKWADDGVKTFDDAERLIRKESEKKNTVNRIAARFGILGTRAIGEAEKSAFLKWHDEYGFELDMIGLAYEETVKNTGKYTYTYIDRILATWHDSGIKTPEQAQTAPKPAPKTKRTSRPAPNNARKTTGGGNDAMDMAWEIAGGND